MRAEEFWLCDVTVGGNYRESHMAVGWTEESADTWTSSQRRTSSTRRLEKNDKDTKTVGSWLSTSRVLCHRWTKEDFLKPCKPGKRQRPFQERH